MQLRLIPAVCFGNSTFPILQNDFSQLETMMKFAGAIISTAICKFSYELQYCKMTKIINEDLTRN